MNDILPRIAGIAGRSDPSIHTARPGIIRRRHQHNIAIIFFIQLCQICRAEADIIRPIITRPRAAVLNQVPRRESACPPRNQIGSAARTA